MKQVRISLCLISILLTTYTGFSQNRSQIDSLLDLSDQALNTNLKKADSSAELALQFSRTIGYDEGLSRAYMILGNSAREKSQFNNSIEYYDKAIEIEKKLNDPFLLANGYSGLANVLSEFGELLVSDSIIMERAEGYYFQAREVYLKFDSLSDLAKNSIQLGILYGRMGKLYLSQFYFQDAYHKALQQNDSLSIAKSTDNIATNFVKQKQFDSCIKWANISIRYQCPDCFSVKINSHNNLGASYFYKIQDDSAKIHYLAAEELAEKHGYPTHLMTAYKNLAELYLQTDREYSALYFRAYNDLLDSLNSVQKFKIFAANHERFHTLELENEKQQAEIARERSRKNQIWVSAIAIGAVALLIFIAVANRQKRRIAEQKVTLKQQRIDGLIQNQELKKLDAVLEGQENERQRIAADLHDRLGSILSAVKLHFTHVETQIANLREENVKQYQKATQLLDEATSEVRKIAHDMASGTLVRFGLEAALHELKQSIEGSSNLSINLFLNLDENRLKTDYEIGIYRIVQEIISNTIRHAKAKKLDIHLTSTEDSITLITEDDGVGFDRTQITEGLGMSNIRNRAQKLGGTAEFDSVPGRGLAVVIEIPVNNAND